MRLKDKVAIVTGSGSGIGKATAKEWTKEERRESLAVPVCNILLCAALPFWLNCFHKIYKMNVR